MQRGIVGNVLAALITPPPLNDPASGRRLVYGRCDWLPGRLKVRLGFVSGRGNSVNGPAPFCDITGVRLP